MALEYIIKYMWRSSVVVMFTGLAALAISMTGENIRAANMEIVAGQVERGEKLEIGEIDSVLRDPTFQISRTTCRSDILRAALAIELANLDSQNIVGGYEIWVENIRRGQEFISHAKSCMPTDGNLWLRDAMLNRAVGENSLLLSRILGTSQRLAPAEGQVLVARWVFWNALQPTTIAVARPTFLRDLRTLLEFGSGSLLKNVVGRLPPGSLVDYQRAVAELSVARGQIIAKITKAAGVSSAPDSGGVFHPFGSAADAPSN